MADTTIILQEVHCDGYVSNSSTICRSAAGGFRPEGSDGAAGSSPDPAVCIGGDLTKGFFALIPNPHSFGYTAQDRKNRSVWHQYVPMDHFLAALFEHRFVYGIPQNSVAKINVYSNSWFCWSCGAEGQMTSRRQTGVNESSKGDCFDYQRARCNSRPDH